MADSNNLSSSNTNSTISTNPEQQSLGLLNSQFAPSLVVCLLSAMAMITNSFLMFTIIKTKDLHNKSQYVILSRAFVETLFATFSFIHHLRRIILITLGWPDLINQLTCAVFLQGMIITGKVAINAILMLCIDRLLAVGAPLVYRRIGLVKYVAAFNLVCWGTVFAQVPIGFFGVDQNGVLLICNFALAFSLTYRTMESVMSEVIASVTLAAYALAIGIVSFRYWGQRWTTALERSNWSRQVQLNAFRMMMAVGCIYLACWGLAQAAIHVLVRYTSPPTQVIYGPYVAALGVLNTGSHFFVYYGFSKTFRKACKKAVCCGGNVVTDVNNVVE